MRKFTDKMGGALHNALQRIASGEDAGAHKDIVSCVPVPSPRVCRFLTSCIWMFILALLMLCACGQGEDKGPGIESTSPPVQAPTASAQAPASAPAAGEAQPQEARLFVAQGLGYKSLSNANGFLQVEYPRRAYEANIMFYDCQTLEQRYLCTVEGCTHDHPGCTSFVDAGQGEQANPFFVGEDLYIHRNFFGDGSAEADTSWELARYNADGTGGEVVAQGEGVLQIHSLFCDGEAFYFAAEEGFACLEIATGEMTVFSDININQGESGSNAIINVFETVYENEILCMRYKNDRDESGNFYPVLSDTTRELFTLNPHTGQQTLLHTFAIGEMSPGSFNESGCGYYVNPETAEVFRFDIATGAHTMVTDMLMPYNYTEMREIPMMNLDGSPSGEVREEIYYGASTFGAKPLGDWLVLDTWILQDKDDASAIPEVKTYGYNMRTGEETEISFGNYFNGYAHAMMVWGQTPHGLLVTEEIKYITVNATGTGGEPYVHETAYDVYALIDLDDFVHSRPNFRTIAPVPYANPLM